MRLQLRPHVLGSMAPAILVALVCGTATASPVDLFGYGPRGAAMAGAVTSTAEGHEGVYYNPALLAFEERPSFSIGYQRADFFLQLNGEDANVLAAPATLVGIAVPIPLRGWLERRLTLGLGFVMPTTSVLMADIPKPGEPRFVLTESRAQTVSIQGALGVRVTDALSLGIGFLALSELAGNIDVAPNAAGRIGADVGDNLLADYSPVFGVLVRPWRTLIVGLSARDESEARFTLPITVDLGDSFNIPVPLLDISGSAQYDPRQVALEVSYRPLPELLVAVGGAFKQWSRYRNPVSFAAVPADFPEQPEANFMDIGVARTGAEFTLNVGPVELRPRAGLSFEPSPVQGQLGFHNYLDNDRYIIASGVGAEWRGIRLDLAAQWQIMPERSDDKLELAGPLGELQPFTSIRYGGDILFFGAAVGLTL